MGIRSFEKIIMSEGELMNKNYQWIVGFLCFLLGIMLVTQFKNAQLSSGIVSLQRAQELTMELKNLKTENKALIQEIEDLRKRIKEYEESFLKNDSITKAMKQELEKTRLLAGLTDVKGHGVVIILDDSNLPHNVGEDPNLFLIHDDDLLKVVNELRAAGAEAISINDQRIIATSEIRCIGPTISINSIKFSPPFKIKAIGDPATLEASLRMRGGVIETLKVWGIRVSLKKQENIVIPGYKGVLKFNHVKPIENGGE